MEIEQQLEEGNLTVKISGRLDTTTAPQLEEQVKLDGVTKLAIDLTGVEYISSAGLRVLLTMQKTMLRQGQMTITGAQVAVKEVFEITGFSEIFTFV